jgi:hypothetical protein
MFQNVLQTISQKHRHHLPNFYWVEVLALIATVGYSYRPMEKMLRRVEFCEVDNHVCRIELTAFPQLQLVCNTLSRWSHPDDTGIPTQLYRTHTEAVAEKHPTICIHNPCIGIHHAEWYKYVWVGEWQTELILFFG